MSCRFLKGEGFLIFVLVHMILILTYVSPSNCNKYVVDLMGHEGLGFIGVLRKRKLKNEWELNRTF
jgi:hypothetical protein